LLNINIKEFLFDFRGILRVKLSNAKNMLKGKKKYLHKWIEVIEWIIEWMQKNELEEFTN